MPKGDLLELIKSEVEGIIYHNVILDEVKLGGRNYPRVGKYLIEVDEPQLNELYLTIISVLNEPVNKVAWKVGIDGLNITREFKPQVVSESPIGSIYVAHVFDLSKVVKGGKTYTLTISCDSSKHITIDGLELVGMKKVANVLTEVSYSAGCVLLNPSESYSARHHSSKFMPCNISLYMNVPSRNALIDISLNNNCIKTLSNLLGLSNVQISDLNLTYGELLSIRHRESNETYYPRFVSIYSLLKYNTNCKGPKITMVLDCMKCERDECKLTLIIRNEGDLICENVMIVGLSASNILIRDVINSIKVGEELHRNYRINAKDVNTRLTFKAIYRRFGKQVIYEVRAPQNTN